MKTGRAMELGAELGKLAATQVQSRIDMVKAGKPAVVRCRYAVRPPHDQCCCTAAAAPAASAMLLACTNTQHAMTGMKTSTGELRHLLLRFAVAAWQVRRWQRDRLRNTLAVAGPARDCRR